MSSGRRRKAGCGASPLSSDSTHLGVPRTRYGLDRSPGGSSEEQRGEDGLLRLRLSELVLLRRAEQQRCSSTEDVQTSSRRWRRAQFRSVVPLDGEAGLKSRSLGSLVWTGSRTSSEECLNRRLTAQERRAAFHQQRAFSRGSEQEADTDTPTTGNTSPADLRSLDSSPPELRANSTSPDLRSNTVSPAEFQRNDSSPPNVRPGVSPLSAMRSVSSAHSLDRTPSVVVSDFTLGDDSVDTPLDPDDWETEALFCRRLSSCSTCSTVSSCGRRGSLLDFEAEGLVMRLDGRLERVVSTVERREVLELCAATGGLQLESPPPGREGGETEEEASRKVSNCSYSSVSTLSQDEEDELAATLTADTPVKKPSQWRKVKGVVQWTPFVQTYKKQKYLWVQLAGHQGNFRAGKDGSIMKRLCGREQVCLQQLMTDPLRPYVPEYRGKAPSEEGDEEFLELQDLLGEFVNPCVMDCKIGVRTYLEDELAKAKEKPKLRKDMYDKMMVIDKSAPTEEEHRLKAVTKPRYMVWRETISSTATLGFRIEGIRKSEGFSSKDFKTTRTRQQIKDAVTMFTAGYPKAVPQYIERLKEIRAALHKSTFFKSHEFIGSSLLFVHDANHACVWMIDFAKTTPLPEGVRIDHSSVWQPGNHEDGYLIGVNNLIDILKELAEETPSPSAN